MGAGLTQAFVFQPPATGLLYVGVYQPELVVASVLIAIFAAYVGLRVTRHMGEGTSRRERSMWTGVGALTLGVGVWAMHFIGMLAFSLPCTVSYDYTLTLISMLPSVLASGIALRYVSRRRTSVMQLGVSGVLLGGGIGAMHYTGMAAYRIDGLIRYDPFLFGLSLVVAVCLAVLALWIKQGLARQMRLSHTLVTALSAVVMGAAISGMHYTAMAAAYFVSDGHPEIPDSGLTPALLAMAVGLVTVLLIGLVLATAMAIRQRALVHRIRASEQRVHRILESTAEGVMLTDAQGKLISVNPAFTQITGYPEAEVLGKNPRILSSGRHDAAFYEKLWAEVAATGHWQGEIWNRRKSGEVYPQWLTLSAVRGDADEGGEVQSYVGVFSDISHIKRSEAALERLAHYDPLTDLPNRALLAAHLGHALDRAQRHNEHLAVMMLDLDGFKTVNDSLGHPAGDLLLQIIAQRLRDTVRQEDTVARLGGDEFAIIVESLSTDIRPSIIAEKIIEAVALPVALHGHTALVTASIGIALYPDDGSDATALFKAADMAMYASKQAGRNTLRYHHADMTRAAHQRLTLEHGLRRAIEQGELEVWYQPQVNLESGERIGAEALVRWRDPEKGLVPPNDFIPLAEETGLVLPLGEWVLRQVCTDAARWLAAGLDCGRIWVNVAGPQIERGNFYGTVLQVLEDTGLSPAHLGLEITESFLLRNADDAMEVVAKLHAAGITVAIDDFGTGYSSLAYLKHLHADKLKIDQQFVRDLPDDKDDAAITRAVIALGRSLGFKLVAEGVESAEQMVFLRAHGCEEAQGYFFSKPLPTAEFEGLLQRNTTRNTKDPAN